MGFRLTQSNHKNSGRTLILGTGLLARELVREMRLRPQRDYLIVGILSESAHVQDAFADITVTGTLIDMQRVIAETKPSRIIVALDIKRGNMPVNQLMEVRIRKGIIIEDGQQLYERLTGKIAIESINPSSVIFSSDYRPTQVELGSARLMSVVLALFGLVCVIPLLVVVATAIKIDSRGPVLFFQDRLGLGDRRFKLYKFRTMFCETTRTSEWVRDNGHRITRVGRWLRKFRIDELPQFFNVLAGDMNIVGPRPHPASNFELLVLVARNTPVSGRPVPYYTLRSVVRPGITGWAQVRYKYANDINEEIEKLRFDLYYIKHYSLWLDIKILFETVKVVLLGRESAETATAEADKMETVRR
jgi:exopolysaccharide biosynthesis polyprenyl glycosylphosphotransferase